MAKKWLVLASKISCAVFLVCMFILVLYGSSTDKEEIELTGFWEFAVFWPGILAAVVMTATFCIEFVLELMADFKARRFRAFLDYLVRVLVMTVVFAVCSKFLDGKEELWHLRFLATGVVCATTSKAVEYWSRIKKQ